MKKLTFALLIITLGCQAPSNKGDIETWKQEVVQTENDFAAMAAAEGLAKAFMTFAADDGVIKREGRLLQGKDSILVYYEDPYYLTVQLDWEPSFVDVSASGDLAYTYGPYTFTKTDTTGNQRVSTGFFHTVWKRQTDGSWRYVWD